MKRYAPLPLLAVLLAVLGPNPARAAEHVVEVRNNVFFPPALTVDVGDTVVWRKGAGFHNVVADDGSFDSGAPTGDPFELRHTFTRGGSFTYHCTPHRAMGMRGTVVVREPGPQPCVAAADVLCLRGGRFALRAGWWTTEAAGAAIAVPLPAMPASGLFYFFGPDNAEMLVKVLDACVPFGRYWVFYAATTDVGFELTVTDTATGAQRVYGNAPGHPAAPVQDVEAFLCP